MTSFTVQAEAPPLREDESGVVRVGNTRVLLELVIHSFQDGATPERIVQQYDTLSLPDVYAVIAYYLRHRAEVDEYLAERERLGDEMQRQFEISHGDFAEIRARLLKRRQSRD